MPGFRPMHPQHRLPADRGEVHVVGDRTGTGLRQGANSVLVARIEESFNFITIFLQLSK